MMNSKVLMPVFLSAVRAVGGRFRVNLIQLRREQRHLGRKNQREADGNGGNELFHGDLPYGAISTLAGPGQVSCDSSHRRAGFPSRNPHYG